MEFQAILRAWTSLLLHVVFAVKTTGLRDCSTNSPRCVSSADLSAVERWECITQGRFPHSDKENSTLYYRCPDANHFGCLCSCRPGKYFDDVTFRCRLLVFLSKSQDSLGAPSLEKTQFTFTKPRDLNANRQGVLNGSGNELHPVVVVKDDKSTRGVEDNDVIYKVLPKNKTRPHVSHNEDLNKVREIVNVHKLDPESEAVEPELQQRTSIASRPSPPGNTKEIILDNSLFPAWAIALVVLCVVIVMVLIVLIIY